MIDPRIISTVCEYTDTVDVRLSMQKLSGFPHFMLLILSFVLMGIRSDDHAF